MSNSDFNRNLDRFILEFIFLTRLRLNPLKLWQGYDDSNRHKKDLSFLIGPNSLTWLRYPKIRGLTKHHSTKVTIFVELTK